MDEVRTHGLSRGGFGKRSKETDFRMRLKGGRTVDNKVDVSIFRYDPGTDFKPRFEKYEVPFGRDEGAGGAEIRLRSLRTDCLRYGCRIKVCGYCR